MPQEFYVLRCYSCEKFQVHIVKKAKKWDCKMCGAKQSFIKIFGQGDARQCREHVQKLNLEAGLESERLTTYDQDSYQKDYEDTETNEWENTDMIIEGQSYPVTREGPSQEAAPPNKKVSKWTCFLDQEDQ